MRRWFLIAWLLAACSTSAVPTNTPVEVAAVPSDSPTAVPTHTPTPFVIPTPPPVPTPMCEGAPSTRLIGEERGRVLDDDPRSVRMRGFPSLESEIVENLPVDTVFFILTGPRCEEGYAWYYVRYERVEGWIAEGDLTSYFVEPYPPVG